MLVVFRASKYLVISSLLLLVGCFDVNQTFEVKEDKTVKYHMQYVFASSLAEVIGEVCDEPGTEKDGELTVTINARESAENIICEYTFEGPINDFDDLAISEEGSDIIVIKKINSVFYRIYSNFTSLLNKQEKYFSEDGPTSDLISSMFASRALRWDISSPKILDSNGTISDDGRSVHWELPLIEIYTEGNSNNSELEFFADISIEESYDKTHETSYAKFKKEEDKRQKEKFKARIKEEINAQTEELKRLEEEIAGLERKKSDAEKSEEVLKDLKIMQAKFYKEDDGRPVIELEVKNQTNTAISKAYFDAVLKSPNRSVAWLEKELEHKISGGIEPGETAKWTLNPGKYSDWGSVKIVSDAIFTVEVTDLDGANGYSLLLLSEKFTTSDLINLYNYEDEYELLKKSITTLKASLKD